MSGDMDTAISAAFDKATASPSESNPSPPSEPTSPVGSPAAVSGSETAPVPSEKPAPAIAAPDEDESITDATTFTLDKHQRILANARKKEAAKVTEALKAQYGLSPEEFAPFQSHIAYIRQHGLAAYYQELGKQFPSQAPTQTAPVQATSSNERPKPDLVAEDGTAAYSASALERLLAWQERQLTDRWTQALTPLQQTHQALQEQAVWSQALQSASEELREASTWEGFEELKPQIHDLMKADGRVTLESAYRRLYQSVYRPQLEQKIRSSVLQSPTQSRNPNTVRTTAAPVTSSPKTVRSMDDAIDQALERVLTTRA